MSQPSKLRAYILITGFVCTIMTGTYYGASLRTEHDYKKERQKYQESPPAAKLAQLNEFRSGLVSKKMALEKKIADLHAKQNGVEIEKKTEGLRK